MLLRVGGGHGGVLASDVVGVPVNRSHLRTAEAPQSLPGDPGAPQQPHTHLPQVPGERFTPVGGGGGGRAGARWCHPEVVLPSCDDENAVTPALF